jgi:hypothetical protein
MGTQGFALPSQPDSPTLNRFSRKKLSAFSEAFRFRQEQPVTALISWLMANMADFCINRSRGLSCGEAGESAIPPGGS